MTDERRCDQSQRRDWCSRARYKGHKMLARKAYQPNGWFRSENRDLKLAIGIVTRIIVEGERGNRPSKREKQKRDAKRTKLVAESMANGLLT